MNFKTIGNFEISYNKLSDKLLIAALFFMPLKLSICLAPLILLILLWVSQRPNPLKAALQNKGHLYLLPFLMLIGVATYSSLFGLDPLHSLASIFSLAFFSLTTLIVFDLAKARGFLRYLTALLSGQTFAAVQSTFESAFPDHFRNLFLGKVTQSGQLALTMVLSIGLYFFLKRESGELQKTNKTRDNMVFFFTLFTAGMLAFSSYLKVGYLSGIMAICLLGICLFSLQNIKKSLANTNYRAYLFVLTLAIPFCTIALLANLKRGPWAGVIIASLLLLFMYYKKLIMPVLFSVVCLFCLVSPIRDRVLQSYDHFYISGGRNVIWEIGQELSAQYPLGIGYENSGVLRKFSSEIPDQLKHFHSNPLNILVETGWIGLGVYLWWILVTLRTSLFDSRNKEQRTSIITRTIGCAILSWQIAGIVEYNFGDSEVLLVVFTTLGILGSLKASCPSSKDLNENAQKTHCLPEEHEPVQASAL